MKLVNAKITSLFTNFWEVPWAVIPAPERKVAFPPAVGRNEKKPGKFTSTSLSINVPRSTSGPVGSLTSPVATSLLSVSNAERPSMPKPAPTLSSASDVKTTGKFGWPTICILPPIRESMSSGVPVAFNPASEAPPPNLTTRLSDGALLRRNPPYV